MDRLADGRLDPLMAPAAIAVVGVSQRGGTGAQVLANLVRAGFDGRVVAVNPKYDELHGVPCFESLTAIPDRVDLVVTAVPAAGTPNVLEEAQRLGIPAAVILAAGFGEGGQHRERAEQIRRLASQGMVICGPNCFGVLNVSTGAAAYSGHVPDDLHSGPVALISQSGGLANRIVDPLSEDRDIGFKYVVSCGNQLGVTLEEYVAYAVEDDDVGVIAAIVERIERPEVLAHAAMRARELGKTMLAFTLGRTETGLRAVQAHTGALVSREDFRSAFLDRIGVLRAEHLEDLVEGIVLHAVSPQLRRSTPRRAIVLSGSGGDAATAADGFSEAGIELPPLQASTMEAIRGHESFPPFATAGNPIDGTGSIFADVSLFQHLIDQAVADDAADVVCVNIQARPGLVIEPFRKFAEMVGDANRQSPRPIVAFQPLGLGLPDGQIVASLHQAGVPLILGTQAAARALALLTRSGGERARLRADNPVSPPGQMLVGEGRAVGAMDAYAALVEHGVPVAACELATDDDQAVGAAERLGFPVAVKVEAPGLLHKSDLGGVVLGCRDADAVRSAFKTVIDRAREAGYQPEGAVIQAMADAVDPVETFISVVVDPVLGPMISLGLGGVLIEMIRDVVIEPAPVDHALATDMIGRLQGVSLLHGHRGRPAADVEALADAIVAVSELAVADDDLDTIELNPVIVSERGGGAVAVDAILTRR